MKLQDIFNNVDALLIYNIEWPNADLNFFYFSRLLDSYGLSNSYYFKSKNKEAIVTNEIYTNLEKISSKKANLGFLTFKEDSEIDGILKKLLSKSKKVGISYSSLPARQFENLKEKFPKIEFVDIDLWLSELRCVKDNFEISLIREAAKISSFAAEEITNYIREGMTENELAGKLTEILMKNGARENAFPPIVAFGEDSAQPHHVSGLRKLKKGDFVLMDFGARYRRYNADMTRTYVFGKGSEKQKRIYSVVKQAQQIGINVLKEGLTGNDVELTVRNFINTTEFKGQPSHGVGHSIGLAVNDHLVFELGSKFVLKRNMIVTMEPGIYLKGFGGVRIEDDVLIKKDGFEVLTSANKEYREI
jgi:Xaa-Pro dipeptidase